MTRKRRQTRSTGVTLELAVLDYLAELAQREDRDRSFCINQIVREHAVRNGRPLPPGSGPAERAAATPRSDEP
jgi:macrodomain Ter protein organizer (MatP/YcbG family)